MNDMDNPFKVPKEEQIPVEQSPKTGREKYNIWARKRALEYVDGGDLKRALACIITDLKEDPSRSKEQIDDMNMLFLILINYPNLVEVEVRSFIDVLTI